MALLFMDGFDHYAGVDCAGSGKWGASFNLGPNPSNSTPRTGIGCVLMTAHDLATRLLPASGGFVVHVAVNCYSGVWNGSTDLIRIYESTAVNVLGTLHMALSIETGGLVRVKRNTTTLATGTTVVPAGGWVHIQFKGTIDDTTGSYEVKIDDATELSATGVDTRNGGTTGQWNVVYFRPSASGGTKIDDVLILDTSGSAPYNTFCGMVKIETLLPQTDAVAAGSNAGLTPSTGTDHGALVDEATPNTSDYNSTSSVGNKDTYNFPTPSLAGSIVGIQTNIYAWKQDAYIRKVKRVVRAGGTDYDGTEVSLTTTAQMYVEPLAQNPNTAADWTTSDITSVQAGMKLTT